MYLADDKRAWIAILVVPHGRSRVFYPHVELRPDAVVVNSLKRSRKGGEGEGRGPHRIETHADACPPGACFPRGRPRRLTSWHHAMHRILAGNAFWSCSNKEKNGGEGCFKVAV